MGKQEYWEADNKDFAKSLNVKIMIGCGGSFDFASGKTKELPFSFKK